MVGVKVVMQCQFRRMAVQFTLFHRNEQILHPPALVVVIPIQTTGFYNWSPVTTAKSSSHVVIPIQTTGFYNVKHNDTVETKVESCHAHPNDRLLQQQPMGEPKSVQECCHTHPNDRLLQHGRPYWVLCNHRCHTHPNDRLLQLFYIM